MPRFTYGWRPSPPDHRDVMFAAASEVLKALPPKVDLRDKFPLPPFNQSKLGSCGPNSAAGDILFAESVQGATKPSVPSRLFIYWNTRRLMGTVNSDSGVDNRSLLKSLATYGWPDEELWPYAIERFKEQPPPAAYDQAAARKISAYSRVPQSLNEMKACVAGGDPFIFGFTVYESFESDETVHTGIVRLPTIFERVLGGHDVVICGYDDATQMFDFRNSYGEEWGQGGYGTIPYLYAINPNLSGDFWTVQKTPLPPAPIPTVTADVSVTAGGLKFRGTIPGVAA